MIRLLKRTVKSALRVSGYSLVKIKRSPASTADSANSIPDCLTIPLDHQRSAAEYDAIWTHPGFIDRYLSESRLQSYRDTCQFINSHFHLALLESIVDVGCGPGGLLKTIHELSPTTSLTGLDFSPNVLEIARTVCPSAEFRQHDICTPLEGGFDLVLCCETLEHMERPAKALEQLVSNAVCVAITVPNGMVDTYPGHINFWSKRSWEVFLEPFCTEWDCTIALFNADRNIGTVLRRRKS